MKVIFNGDENKVIEFTTFERVLNVHPEEDSNVSFYIYLNNNEKAYSSSLKFLGDYINTQITEYAIYDNEDQLVSSDENINMQLMSFSEQIADTYYTSQATLHIFNN